MADASPCSDRRDWRAAMRAVPRRLRRLADAGDAGLLLHPPGRRPSRCESYGVDHPYFFGAVFLYNFLANLTGQPSIVLPCGFSKEACRSACSSPASAGATPSCWRRQGAGEAVAALSGAAELQD
jgi:Asp-tRNA(Asn)/Glu-tRNA(Gln) amidotransferase A subunit family amidase